MIGSLQEFLGHIDSQTFFSQQNRAHKEGHGGQRVRSAENTLKNERFMNVKHPNSGHIATVKYATKRIKQQNRSQSTARNQQSLDSSSKEVICSSLMTQDRQIRSGKWTIHVPQSKHNMLKAFARLRRNEQDANSSKIMQKLNESAMPVASKQQKKASQMHLKGSLKHEHQLLRSIQRVQAQDLLNPRTFLEMSLESLANSYEGIKIKPLLRGEEEVEKTVNPPQKNMASNNGHYSGIDKWSQIIKPSSQRTHRSLLRMSQRLLIQKEHRWAKVRAKSTESYEKSLGNALQTEEFTKKLNKDRKDLMKKMSDLIDRASTSVRKVSMIGSKLFK